MQVFVYGTLKYGFGNHDVIRHSGGKPGIYTTFTPPIYDMIDLGYFPGVIKGEYSIKGERYEVETLAYIDQLEGHPHFYKREMTEEGYWIYLYNSTYTAGRYVPEDEHRVKEWKLCA